MSQNIGTVKWFDINKGYGFIMPDDGGRDIFVHMQTVQKSGMERLHEGQKVHYDIYRNPKNGKVAATDLQQVA